jgi:hypothetical protein
VEGGADGEGLEGLTGIAADGAVTVKVALSGSSASTNSTVAGHSRSRKLQLLVTDGKAKASFAPSPPPIDRN